MDHSIGVDATRLPGIKVREVTEWLQREVPGAVAPFTVRLIAGGRSNLTYLVNDSSGQRFVLRRPPLGSVLATAHDMSREYRIIDALADTDVPVAPAVAICNDVTVNEAPFYIMKYVEGPILATRVDALAYPEADRRTASFTLMDVLGRIHAVQVDEVGLGTLGRRENYLQRQLARWQQQYEKSKSVDIPVLDEVFRRLAASVPEQKHTGLVHGDFRLGNMILGPGGTISAVLDWELSTLGDVLADVGWLMSSWIETGEESRSPLTAASSAPGFASRREMAEAYAGATGRDLTLLPYYLAFSYWRSACIGTGVVARYRAAAMAADDFDVDQHARTIVETAQRALTALEGGLL
ncbi:MAG: phosphotransferase family protein [Actinomycetota bacterium]